MANEGRYIYSIIHESEDRSFGLMGMHNREVHLVCYKDIAAVVSDTPVINFDRLDKTELMKYIAIHQNVNEGIAKDYDAVPMTFGIIAPNLDEALRMLEKAYFQFKMVLTNVSGRAEFAVQVRWNPKRIFEELVGADAEIQELKQELSSKGGMLGMPIKLKLGRLVYQKIEAQKLEYINDIHTALHAIACDAAYNKLTDEDMIVHFSFLVEKVKESEFDKRIQELGKKYEGKLRFKYIGPMAVYSFNNINLGMGNFEIIDDARNLLGLGENAAFDEIKKAYYALSHAYHPDTYGGEPETAEKMQKVNEAYRILKNYCQNCDEFMGKADGQTYSFREEDVKNSLMIS